MQARIDRWLGRVGANRAVLFSVSTQAWMGLIGPATTVVIAGRLDPATQGFYYTFSSLLGLQVLFELGLATVVVQSASHEWVHLFRAADGSIRGNDAALGRLASLGRFSVYWYSVAAALFVAIFLPGGMQYFEAKAAGHAVTWWAPWAWLVIAIGLYLLIQPLFSLVEGCNQVDSLYRIRLVQAIVASLGTIIALGCGAGLYSLAVGAWLRLIVGVLWLVLGQRGFCLLVLTYRSSSTIEWRQEVWPFQWRIALSWLSGYVAFSLITPVMFQIHGPVVAGQMGMSLVIAGAVESVAVAWLNTRSPQFGMLAARRDFQGLDELFSRSLRASLAIALAGFFAVMLAMTLLQSQWPHYASRLLPFVPLTLLVAYRVANILVTGMALYLRAHKQEPFMGVSIVNACLVGLAFWWLGRNYGAFGAILGSLAVTLLWTLPVGYRVFRRCRLEWHH